MLGGVALKIDTEDSGGSVTSKTRYLHTDHIGSVVAITDENAIEVARFRYDPFGKQHTVINQSPTLQIPVTQWLEDTQRGFTGHEMLSSVDVIHMNGRTYDANIGRFMQADPYIQAPKNMQSMNRYSYVLNNPLRYTDPSGFFFKDLVKGDDFLFGSSVGGGTLGGVLQGYINHNVHKFVANSQTLVQTGALAIGVVTSIYCGACSIGFTGLYTSNMASYQGASTSEAFHAGGKAAAIAGGFYAIGSAFDAENGFWENGGNYHIAAHAVTGGVIADLQGGKFAHGFWAAGVTKAAGSGINGMCSNCGAAGVALRVIVAATLGGTVSKLSGGKFSNGARTAAFAQLFNNELNRKPKTLNLTSEEANQIKSAIHDLIVDMEDKAQAAFFENNRGLLRDLLGLDPYSDSSNIDVMLIKLAHARFANGNAWIHSSVKLRTEQGLRFLAAAAGPKWNFLSRAFNGLMV